MEVLHGGIIKNGKGAEQDYIVRRLGMEDLEGILSVQGKVVSLLSDKKVLQPLAEEEFRDILQGRGLMIGAFVGSSLVAFRALLVPEVDDGHLGRDIGIEEDLLEKVIYQEISNVLPEYRGNKLQRTLAILIMQELEKEERDYRYACCTVAPFNIPSLKDKFDQGMEIAALKEKYGGMLRYVFVKDLAGPEMQTWDEVISIPMEDTALQQEKIALGWRGFQMEPIDGNWHVYYGLRKEG
ncbi:GNAT family N-acetyltransferase [Bacillus sp. REN3]|uniref:GNAT family N-acetyltransferase n=1 Tax=Bacillus sp. REN3 TaxID=2802440 RepID=UPI001AEEEB59|nr:GNAT family N-acetyltransferase [Bacillus sp. REN3]